MNRKIWGMGLAVLLALPGLANATLINRGSGLIYDDVLDITWLQDANYAKTSGFDTDGRMIWANANAWAAGLTFGGFDDWRLPTLSPVSGGATFDTVFSTNATTDEGYADSAGWVDGSSNPVSEMGYMYYANLGNLGFCPPDGGDGDPATCDNGGSTAWGLNNVSFIDGITGSTVSFSNVQSNYYWSGTEFAPKLTRAWFFNFKHGGQSAGNKNSFFFAWAVRSGDVAASVPEPGTIILLGLGLVGMSFSKGRKRRL